MNDDVIIVIAYPNTKEKIEILKSCLLQLRKTGKEILLGTHYPATDDIISLTDYYIYDNRNEIISAEEYINYVGSDSAYYYFRMDKFTFYIKSMNDYYHFFAIYQLFESIFKYAQILGKKYVYFTDGDNIIQDLDLHQFDDIRNRVISKNKKAYFQFNLDFASYSLMFFFTELDFFMNVIQFVKTKNEYMEKYKSRMFLESVITDEFIRQKLTDKIEIDEWNAHSQIFLFPNSFDTINLSSLSKGSAMEFQRSGLAFSEGAWYLASMTSGNSRLDYHYTLLKNDIIIESGAYLLNHVGNYFYKMLDIQDVENFEYKLQVKFVCDYDTEYTALDLTINKNTVATIKKLYEIKWKVD